VHTAPHPLGPWTQQGEVACAPAGAAGASAGAGAGAVTRVDVGGAGYRAAALGPATPTPGQGCQYADPSTTSTTRSQQSDVFRVDLADGTSAWVWAGDRWQQSPDGTKAHDPQFWAPLTFNADGSIAPITWIDNFTLPIV